MAANNSKKRFSAELKMLNERGMADPESSGSGDGILNNGVTNSELLQAIQALAEMQGSATLNAEDWSVRFEAQAPDLNGNMLQYVIEGTVENLGSWTNRRISGTWQHGDESGDFMVVLN